MRVVMVVPGGVDRSGRRRVIPAVLWLIERLSRQHDMLVIALNQEPAYCEYELLGAKVICLGQGRYRTPEFNLAQRFKQFQRALQHYGKKPEVFHAIGAGQVGVLAGLMARRYRVPLVLSIFSGELVWLPAIRYGWQGNWRGRLAVRQAIHFARVVTAGSMYAGEAIKTKPWTWLPLGVDDKLFSAPVERPPGPPWRLIHVAHINPVKNQETLLQAVSLVAAQKHIHLDWFGEDTLNGEMQALCRRLGLDSIVNFHGVQPVDHLVPFYRRAHVFIQSSLHESQGVAVCEAAAAGVPTIGTAVGLAAELAPKAASTVPPADAPALAKAVMEILETPSKREQLGREAKEWAQAHNADWTASQFSRLYQQAGDF